MEWEVLSLFFRYRFFFRFSEQAAADRGAESRSVGHCFILSMAAVAALAYGIAGFIETPLFLGAVIAQGRDRGQGQGQEAEKGPEAAGSREESGGR